MNNELRDSPEQEDLRARFRSTHSRPSPTTACPCCLPDCKRKSAYFFERGTVELEDGTVLTAMRCNNCAFIRTSKPREASTEITPAQQKAIDRVKNFFSRHGREELTQWEVKRLEWGTISVVAKTGANMWTEDGGHFFVGRRGSLKLVTIYGLFSKPEFKESHAKHVAFSIGGCTLGDHV